MNLGFHFCKSLIAILTFYKGASLDSSQQAEHCWYHKSISLSSPTPLIHTYTHAHISGEGFFSGNLTILIHKLSFRHYFLLKGRSMWQQKHETFSRKCKTLTRSPNTLCMSLTRIFSSYVRRIFKNQIQIVLVLNKSPLCTSNDKAKKKSFKKTFLQR